MQHHNLFSLLSIFLLLFALLLTIVSDIWYSAAFYVFAMAAAFRSISLKKDVNVWKNGGYILFALGIFMLAMTFVY